MKPVIYALAGAGVLVALAAGPVAAQGRERPAGAPGGGSAAGGGATARNGGGSGGSSMSAPTSSSSPRSSGGGSSSGYVPSAPTGSRSPSGTSPRGATWRSNPANGDSPVVRLRYGAPNDRAVPRGARPNPTGTTIGQAMMRPQGPPEHRSGRDINWYYSPWLFSGFGFYNFLYYDPFWWDDWGYPYGYAYGYDAYGDPALYGAADAYSDEPQGRGGLKLKVEPKDAEVYVDGYYMGSVDDFNGVFQRMDLEVGPHHVEIRAPGYRTVAFDVRIELNDTVTYRGDLQPLSKR
jgi:PEGA domain